MDMIPSSIYGRICLVAVIVQAIIVIILESILADAFLEKTDLIQDTPAVGIPVYLMIFVFSQVFQVIVCWDAVLHQNTIQVIGFVIFELCTFVYSIFQYGQMTTALEDPSLQNSGLSYDELVPYIIGISALLGVFLILYAFLAFKLYLEFGWKIYKKIGADPQMKQMYRTYQIFVMILKMDFFFFVAFAVQFLVLTLRQDDPEYALTIIAVPATVLVLGFAVYGLREENKTVMIMFKIGCVCAMSYFIFKLVRFYDPTQEYKYLFTRNFLTFFAVLSLILVTLTLINSVVCYLNFDKGLKPHISINAKPKTNRTNPSSPKSDQVEMDRKMNLGE